MLNKVIIPTRIRTFAQPENQPLKPSADMKKAFLLHIILITSYIVSAQNVIKDTTSAPQTALKGLFADPHIAVFGNRYYIYPTTDGFEHWASSSFSCFSSKDLKRWKNEGIILQLGKDVTWASKNAWAPCIAKKKNLYYYYFSAESQIGVAVGKKPTGPFKDALNKPLIAKKAFKCQSIDPMVFTDNDGASYLYFGQGKCMVVKLYEDMISFDPTAVKNITPKGYNEGSFVLKRNGKYYLMWSEYDTRDPRYSVAYAISDSPIGPFIKAENNPILRQKGVVKGAGHHSVVQVPDKDEWYIVYHRFSIPNGNGYNRETCISPMRFDESGQILPVDVFESVNNAVH